MTKSELIARLQENNETPFYKATYKIEEVISLINTIEEEGELIIKNQVETITQAMDYIEENIADTLPPFSALGENTREWIKDHIAEYIEFECYDEETREELIRSTQFESDCINIDEAEFEIEYGNQIVVDRDSISIDAWEVRRTLEEIVTEVVESSVEAVNDFCLNIEKIEAKRYNKSVAEAEAKAKAEAEESKSDEGQLDETENTEN